MVVHVDSGDRPDWRIGIEHATDPRRIRAVVPLRSGAVATSGLAHRGAHVVDARSGRAPTALASVTVVGPDLTGADIDATAALALDADAPAWLATRPGITAYLQWADGRTETFSVPPG
jgi:thiamine biosynthesis lipoprotein